MSKSDELEKAKRELDEALSKGRRLDPEGPVHLAAVMSALGSIQKVKTSDPATAYEIGQQALGYEKCPEQERIQLYRELGSIALDLGRPQEGLDHFMRFRDWATKQGDDALELYAEWMVTCAMGQVASIGIGIDILNPPQLMHMALEKAKSAHDESKAHLGAANGRFVFVASVVDRVPMLNAATDLKQEVKTCLVQILAVYKLINEHQGELGHLLHRAQRAEAVLIEWLNKEGK